MTQPMINLAGEGYLDLAVLRRLSADAGFLPSEEYGRQGKNFIDKRLGNWNAAAAHAPWLVLRDLDSDSTCAGDLAARLLPKKSELMCFRIAVREIESWLLADQQACIDGLGFRAIDLQALSDTYHDAKGLLLAAARRSRIRDIREGLVERMKSGAIVEGALYNTLLTNFVVEVWRPDIAERRNGSLRKARQRLAELLIKARASSP
jgi:hypothetical protein